MNQKQQLTAAPAPAAHIMIADVPYTYTCAQRHC